MNWTVNGIPAHPLLVHLVVVFVPLATIAAVLAVVWPAARRRLGIVMPLLVSIGGVSAALAMQAGEWLEGHVTETALVEAHTDHAEMVVPWIAVFFFAAWGHWAWYRFGARREVAATSGHAAPEPRRGVRRWAPWVLGAALAVTAVGATTTVAIVGDAGAKAVWSQQTH